MNTRSVGFFAAILSLTLLASCERSGADKPAAAGPLPVPVGVAVARSVDAPILLRAIGSVESRARVNLRPQVTARVKSLSVAEGSDVVAGQELVRLDSGPFESVLREAEANLARARAVAEDAHRLVERVSEAVASNSFSKQGLEEAQAKAKAADADVRSAEARVETARWNVSYCTIHAPFDGRLGAYMVRPGAIVKGEEADLVEIVQTDPIDVGFAVGEDHIPGVRAAMGRGPVSVEASSGGETGPAATGTLTFIDSSVDPSTGTIRLKATFPNADRRLWPGRFSNVTVLLGHEAGSVSIPDSAVQSSQAGASVFVVNSDQSVELREVKVRRRLDGQSIIESGVKAGETVVTEGQLRLGPKSKVQVKEARAAGVLP
ncbi:MAG: efflux RND transporter periplasmic adaptor subunit [Planctomycetota bacterium]